MGVLSTLFIKKIRYMTCTIRKVILLIYSLIPQCIDRGQYIHVRHTQSTKVAWDALNQQYNKVSLYQRHFAPEAS